MLHVHPLGAFKWGFFCCVPPAFQMIEISLTFSVQKNNLTQAFFVLNLVIECD